jgi:NAD(P)-dependent dehydrogenase (short-subunit alcohol dehydrogenase family)
MKNLESKVAMITGAARGIGRAAALRFAEHGCHVALSDMNLEGVQETASLCEAKGVRAVATRTDVTKTDDVNTMVAHCIEKLGGIDALFNNAGVFYNAGRAGIHDMSDDEWDRMIAICLTGVFKVSRAVLAHWVSANKAGAIVNSASISAAIAFTRSSHYCAAKAGVASFTRCTALEYGPIGVRCNSIAPGIIQTDMTKPALSSEATMADWMRRIPLKKLGQPEDVADVVVWLASDESRYVTGDMIFIDGGWMME